MKVISYSLFSQSDGTIAKKYLKGLEANWIAKEQHYPNWEMVVYHDKYLPESHVDFMQRMKIKSVLRQTTRGKLEGCFWRFAPVSDPQYSVVLVRDIDSRLNARERSAVEEWMDSPMLYHAMRDNRSHRCPVMGGMWGCKRNNLFDFDKLFKDWQDFDRYGCDQRFLHHCLWPLMKNTVMVHDSHPEWAQKHAPEGLKAFPKHPNYRGFVGQVFH
jgi:hypothetical protein